MLIITFKGLGSVDQINRFGLVIKICSKHTFPVYLFHYPLLVLLSALYPMVNAFTWAKISGALFVLIAAVLLGLITEIKRDYLRGKIVTSLDFFSVKMGKFFI